MATALRTAVFLFLFAAVAAAQEGVPTGIQVGSALPTLAGVDLEGKPVKLQSYYGEGTMVLSFWSVHCTDCIRELDDLRSLRREFPAEQVSIVAVNTDSGLPVGRVADFVRRYEAARGQPLNVAHLLDRDAGVIEALGIRYIPLLVVTDRTGRVTSVVTGYAPEDKPRVARVLEEGRVALGAWSAGLRGRVRTLLRSGTTGGQRVEWGSFRVEEGMALFGLYDNGGWLVDVAGRRDRTPEAKRVEEAVDGRLRASLLRSALASLGVRPSAANQQPFQSRGAQVPESPLVGDGSWKRLYDALAFDGIFDVETRAGRWVGDEYWAGLVADVDLGTLRQRLELLTYPLSPSRIRLETVSDYDFKARAVFEAFQRTSYRLQAVDGEEIVYYGDAARLAEEVRGLSLGDLRIFVEVRAPDIVRIEIL